MALKTTPRVWLLVRLSALLLVSLSAPLFYRQMHQEFEGDVPSFAFVAVLLVVAIVAVLFPMSLQRINPMSAIKWSRPSWESNPADIRQPIQTFHLGGWIFLVLGVSVGIYTLWIGSRNLLFVLPLTIGIGIVLGVRLSVLLLRDRFSQ